MPFINLSYSPRDDVVCRFYFEPAYGIAFDVAAERIAAKSSIARAAKLAPKIFAMDPRTGIIDVAYPSAAFEPGNFPQILSALAGGIFELKEVAALRLLDITLPPKLLSALRGPKYGIEGVRKILKIKDHPLLGSVVEPSAKSTEYASAAYNCWIGGLDVILDGASLTSQKFSRFKARIAKVLAARDRAERRTGEPKMYIPNITAETTEMLRRAQHIVREGGECAAIDVSAVGWSAVQTLRNTNEKLKLILYGHRGGAPTRSLYGIHATVLSKLARALGLDAVDVGVVDRAASELDEILKCKDALTAQKVSREGLLPQNWKGIGPAFPAISVHNLVHIPKLLERLGRDLIVQFNVHVHPSGALSGAKAAKQALTAALQGTDIKEYAKTHEELSAALQLSGV